MPDDIRDLDSEQLDWLDVDDLDQILYSNKTDGEFTWSKQDNRIFYERVHLFNTMELLGTAFFISISW